MAKKTRDRITVAIVTKNRAGDLAECLESLYCQTVHPDRILVVDNGSVDATASTVRKIARKAPYPIRLVSESGNGFVAVYNRALDETESKWIAFIDDDCVADREWFRSVVAATRETPHMSVFIGDARTYWRESLASLVMAFNIYLWRRKGIADDGTVVDYSVLDNKNIVYDMDFLRRYHLRFALPKSDSCKILYGEDADLGMRIRSVGGLAKYVPGMGVMHKDPRDMHVVIRKVGISKISFDLLERDWQRMGMTKHKVSENRNTIGEILRFSRIYRLSVWKTAALTGMLYAVWITAKLLWIRK